MRDDVYFSLKEQRKRLRFVRSTGEAIHFWVFLRETGSHGTGWRDKPLVGSVTVTSIIRGFFQNAFLGYKVDARHARRGYMFEAIGEVLSYVFNTLDLHRIEANVMPNNIASRALLEKLGFCDEGLAKSYLKIQGRWEDHTHMVLLAEQWRRYPIGRNVPAHGAARTCRGPATQPRQLPDESVASEPVHQTRA